MWYLDFIDVESSEGRTVTYFGQPYALRGGLSCADSNDPELSQRTSSARRRYDDSGPGAFRRFVRSVDVTRASCGRWQKTVVHTLPPTTGPDFWTRPKTGSCPRSASSLMGGKAVSLSVV